MPAKPKPPRTTGTPLTELHGGKSVIDARGINRTFPSDPKGRQRLLSGIQRKLEAQKRAQKKEAENKSKKKIFVPQEITRNTAVKILTGLGFKRNLKTSQLWFSPKFGRIVLPVQTNIPLKGQKPQLQKLVRLWLEKGNKI